MTSYEHLLDMAAKTAMNTFRLSCQYFYEDRKTGQRCPIQCIERSLEFVENDPDTNATLVHTLKCFLIDRTEWETLDAWRSAMNIDVQKEPTPFGGDYIIRIGDDETKRYEITYREPYTVIGANRALYRINTVFVKKDGTY